MILTRDRGLIAVFVLFFLLFLFIYFQVGSDILLHARLVQSVNLGIEPFPPNLLVYILVSLVSFFSVDIDIIGISFALVLAIAVTFKYSLSQKILFAEAKNPLRLFFLPILLLFFFAIIEPLGVLQFKSLYLGRVTANVYHNSTTIVLYPFALWLFWKTWLIIDNRIEFKSNQLIGISVLVVINILIKPSFFFVYVPATLIMIVLGFKSRRELLKLVIPITIGCILILIQYILIFEVNPGSTFSSKNSVAFSNPFEVWKHYLPLWYIPIALITSYALPIIFLILFRRTELVKNRLFLYASMLNAFGLFIAINIQEVGPRKYDGNFFWQNTVALYILILVVVLLFFKYQDSNNLKKWKSKLFIVVGSLHFFSGILYLIKLIITKSIN